MIQPRVGHVAPEMMKTYSHIREHALSDCSRVLNPFTSCASGRQRSVAELDAAVVGLLVLTRKRLRAFASSQLVLSLFADYRLVAVNLRTLTWLAISIVIRSSPNSTGPE